MTVKIDIHKTHRQYTDQLETVEVDGKTIGECIDSLIKKFPGMEKALFNNKATLKNHIEFYLNSESTYPDELKKKVSEGDCITITVMLAGG